MSAPELCESVEATIAFWRSMAPSAKNLQRVPEFKSEKDKDERLKKKRSHLTQLVDTASNSANTDVLFNLVHGCEPESNNITTSSPHNKLDHFKTTARSASSSRINVTRIGEDARQLTAEEYRVYGPIIAKMSQNVASNSSTTGQPLAGSAGGAGAAGSGLILPPPSAARERQPVLLSVRSPLHDLLRQRTIPSGSLPPVPAEPSAAPVPVLEQESVLDLSSNRQRRRAQQQQIQDHLNATRNSSSGGGGGGTPLLAPPTIIVQRTTTAGASASRISSSRAASNSLPVLAMSLRGALERLNPRELSNSRRGGGGDDSR